MRNGGIAPGTLTEQLANVIRTTTGNVDFDGYLSSGYLTNVGSFNDQSQADREARKSPPVSIWLKGSGAIHSLDVNILLEQ